MYIVEGPTTKIQFNWMNVPQLSITLFRRESFQLSTRFITYLETKAFEFLAHKRLSKKKVYNPKWKIGRKRYGAQLSWRTFIMKTSCVITFYNHRVKVNELSTFFLTQFITSHYDEDSREHWGIDISTCNVFVCVLVCLLTFEWMFC